MSETVEGSVEEWKAEVRRISTLQLAEMLSLLGALAKDVARGEAELTEDGFRPIDESVHSCVAAWLVFERGAVCPGTQGYITWVDLSTGDVMRYYASPEPYGPGPFEPGEQVHIANPEPNKWDQTRPVVPMAAELWGMASSGLAL